MSESVPAGLEELEAMLGYRFTSPELLEAALRHASYSHEHPEEPSNERLEFLGDAVIGLVVASTLYEAHPDWEEGDLTRSLHGLVDRRSLAAVGEGLALGRFVRLGRTEIQSQGSGKATIIGNAMEAVIGAVYLDGGIDAAKTLALRLFGDALSPSAPRAERDAKTRFQEETMRIHSEFPVYEVMSDSGREDDESRFVVVARLDGEVWAEGAGRSKRRAEHAAAEAGLKKMEDSGGG